MFDINDLKGRYLPMTQLRANEQCNPSCGGGQHHYQLECALEQAMRTSKRFGGSRIIVFGPVAAVEYSSTHLDGITTMIALPK